MAGNKGHKSFKQRQSEKKAKRAAAVIIGIIAVVVCVGYFYYLFSDDIATDEGFKEYASQRLEETRVYGPGTDSNFTTYDVNEKTGLAVTGDKCSYGYVNDTLTGFTDSLRNEYTSTEEGVFRAVIVDSAVTENKVGTVSLLATYTVEEKDGRSMNVIDQGFRTWIFNKDNGKQLVWQQVFNEGYEAGLKGFFEGKRSDFSSYMLSDKDLTYFFMDQDEETGADVITPVRILPRYYQSWLREEVLARYIDPNKPMVALTYDDGPGLKSEDKIHDVLEKHDAVATFFYSGYMIKGKERQLKRSVANGCEIGSHTWDHPVLTRCSKKNLKKQLKKTNKKIKKACGQNPTVFRPSYGITNKKINKKSKLPVILWDVDTLDWKSRNAKKIFKSVKKKKNLDGRIILMHCIYDETADATALIVPYLEKKGYQFVTVSELIEYKTGKKPKPGKVYRQLYK